MGRTPLTTSWSHCHSCESTWPPAGANIPRLSTSLVYLARPARCTTASLLPPSGNSLTSISTSSPVHSWKPPEPSAPEAPLPPLPWSRTRNRKVVASRESATERLRGQGALGVAGDAHQDELQRLGDCEPDLA